MILMMAMKFCYLLLRLPKGFYALLGIAVGANLDDLYPVGEEMVDFFVKKYNEINHYK